MARPVHPYFLPAVSKRTEDHSVLGAWIKRGFERSRALAVMLTIALASVLLVTDQLIDSWEDGYLFAVWVALWVVAFAVPALLTSSNDV